MRYFKADLIHNGSTFIQPNSVLVVHDDGSIDGIVKDSEVGSEDVQTLPGIICPGLINTHCHLELSHMRGMLDEHTGLIPFIKGILAKRDAPEQVIQDAIYACDAEMSNAGIVAVGDISNTSDTFKCKSESDIYYHTFVEIFHLDPREADTTLQTGIDLIQQLSELRLTGSLAPHAPYTVSPELFKLISKFNDSHLRISSMHNQETKAENQFFLNKSGSFKEFFDQWGIDTSAFQPTGTKSLPGVIDHMSANGKTLLVHNTFSETDDVELAKNHFEEVFWCTNPNANLYIENNLPNYQTFMSSQAIVTMGTDSIASNWQLSILEEMKTLQLHKPGIPLELLLRWATSNGAKALDIDDRFGSFMQGMSPGIVHIDHIENGRLTNQSSSRKIL